jgi:hypothetical protein
MCLFELNTTNRSSLCFDLRYCPNMSQADVVEGAGSDFQHEQHIFRWRTQCYYVWTSGFRIEGRFCPYLHAPEGNRASFGRKTRAFLQFALPIGGSRESCR